MKRKIALVLAVILVVALAAVVAVACNETETKVTLSIDRGGVGENIEITELPGTDVSELIPLPNDTQSYYFGGWYENANFEGEAVELPTKMPNADKSYFARWYVKYAVDVLLEKPNGQFEKSEELSFAGEANKGATQATFEMKAPAGYVDAGDPKTGTLAGRDSAFEIRFELSKAVVTFDFGGVGENVAIEAKRGTDISAQLPTAADTAEYFFGGWFKDSALTQEAGDEMSATPDLNTTYFARWYRTYKVEAYKQNEGHTGYDYVCEKSFEINKGEGSATVSAAVFDGEAQLAGYLKPADIRVEITAKSGSVGKLYFDRNDATITYDFGGAAENIADYLPKGDEYTPSLDEALKSELYAKGYRFVCLSLDGTSPAGTFAANEDTTVFVVFDKAYTERGGSSDLLWLPKNEQGKAYLYREGLDELQGVYTEADGMFRFEKENLTGKVYDDNTFATQREAYTFKLYDPEEGATDEVTLALNGLDGGTLTVAQGGDLTMLIYVDENLVEKLPELEESKNTYAEMSVPSGTYQISYRTDPNPWGDTAVKFVVEKEGESLDVELHIHLGMSEEPDLTWTDIFVMRGEEFGLYHDEYADILLDGYGYAYYILDDGRYTIGRYQQLNIENNIFGKPEYYAAFLTGSLTFEMPEVRTPDENGIPTADIARYDGIYGEFVCKNGEETLYISGYGYAYVDDLNDESARYSYVFENGAALAGYYIHFITLLDDKGEVKMKALVNSEMGEYYKLTDKNAMVYATTFLGGPAEILTIDGDVAMHFVNIEENFKGIVGEIRDLGENDDGVTIYQFYSEEGEGVEPEEGEVEPEEGGLDPYDFNYFMLESEGVISCYYEGTPVYVGTFEGERGEKMTLSAFGEATYVAADGAVHEGRYLNFTFDGVMYFMCYNDAEPSCTECFNFVIEDGVFKLYVESLEDAVDLKLLYGSSVYTNFTLTIAKDGSATVTAEDPEDESNGFVVRGKAEMYDLINIFSTFWTFKVESVTGNRVLASEWEMASDFKFEWISVMLEDDYIDVFVTQDGLEGEYDVDGNTLTLDGFSNGAFLGVAGQYQLYTDGMDGESPHYLLDFWDNMGKEYFFDIEVTPDSFIFTKRGAEFVTTGYNMYLENGNWIPQIVLIPDGRGNVEVGYISYDDGGTTLYSMAIGRYEADETLTLHVHDMTYTHWVVDDITTQEECDFLNELAADLQTDGGMGATFDVTLFTLDNDTEDNQYFQVLNTTLKNAFVLEDFSVLFLNGFYSAKYINRYGEAVEGEYSATTYIVEDENGDESEVQLVRIPSEELAFVIEDGKAEIVGWEYGLYAPEGAEEGQDFDAISLDGRGCIIYLASDGSQLLGTYTADIDTMTCFAEMEDDSRLAFRFVTDMSVYIMRDDSVAGEYVCVEKDGTETGDILTMDGMGRASIVFGDGGWQRYDAYALGGGVFELDNHYYEDDIINVKLSKSDSGNTYRVSDGLMIVPDPYLPFITEVKFVDFKNGGTLTDDKLTIDSFEVVRVNDIEIGYVTTSEELDSYTTIYNIAKNDGGETRFLVTLNTFKYGYGVMIATEYDAQTDHEFTDAKEMGYPLYFNGFGIGMREGNAPDSRNDSYNAIYWFEGEELHVDDLIAPRFGERRYTLNFEDHTYVMDEEDFHALFTVDENGVLTKYNGTSSDVVLPTDMGIREIGEGVFSKNTLGFYMRSIDLSGVVEVIGKNAFTGEGLSYGPSSIIGLEKVKRIETEAFKYTMITEVELPSIEYIAEKAFFAMKTMKKIVLGSDNSQWAPEGIGDNAFSTMEKVLDVYINTQHAPKLGTSAFLSATATNRARNFYFKYSSAYNEAKDASSEIGASWQQYDGVNDINFVDLPTQGSEGISLRAAAFDMFFEDKRAA